MADGLVFWADAPAAVRRSGASGALGDKGALPGLQGDGERSAGRLPGLSSISLMKSSRALPKTFIVSVEKLSSGKYMPRLPDRERVLERLIPSHPFSRKKLPPE